MSESGPFEFKFRYVRGGNAASLFSSKGRLEGDTLWLGEQAIPCSQIADTSTRDNRLILVLAAGIGLDKKAAKYLVEGRALVLEVSRPGARELKQAIDRLASAQQAEQTRAKLAAAGRAGDFRVMTCGHCSATIDLSGLARSNYVHCGFCESGLDPAGAVIDSGELYRHCDECGFFDRVKGYTEFYFYFLLVIYGFRYKRRHVCDACAHKIFVKMLLLNLLFVVGIIPSIWIKIKSRQGRESRYAMLAKANALSAKGRYREAAPLFAEVHQTQPEHPAVLFNEGLGALNGGNSEEAAALFERSLRACSNYGPTVRLLARIGTGESSRAEASAA